MPKKIKQDCFNPRIWGKAFGPSLPLPLPKRISPSGREGGRKGKRRSRFMVFKWQLLPLRPPRREDSTVVTPLSLWLRVVAGRPRNLQVRPRPHHRRHFFFSFLQEKRISLRQSPKWEPREEGRARVQGGTTVQKPGWTETHQFGQRRGGLFRQK